MSKTVVVLATLDTKGNEARYVADQIEAMGGAALLMDIGIVGDPAVEPGVSRAEVAAAGGTPLAEILEAACR